MNSESNPKMWEKSDKKRSSTEICNTQMDSVMIYIVVIINNQIILKAQDHLKFQSESVFGTLFQHINKLNMRQNKTILNFFEISFIQTTTTTTKSNLSKQKWMEINCMSFEAFIQWFFMRNRKLCPLATLEKKKQIDNRNEYTIKTKLENIREHLWIFK